MNSSSKKINSPLSSFLGYQLRRASIVMMLDLRTRLDKFDMSPTLASILIIVNENEDITQSKIAKFLYIKRANMVPLVASLENRGLIYKEALDGRSQSLLLTEKGQQLLEKIHQEINSHEEKFQGKLGAEDAESIIKTLSTIWSDDNK